MDCLVLIDSNAIIANHYKLSTSNLKKFFLNNKLAIAEPTIKEVLNKFNDSQMEKESEVDKAFRNANKYGVSYEFKITEKVDLESRFNEELRELNAEVLSTKKADINFIFDKSILREKPFKVNGKGRETGGFRDALIWSIWLNYLKENQSDFKEIIIVNSDTDFIGGDSLQKDLLHDLSSYDIQVDKITIKKNIKLFTEFVLEYHKEYQEFQQNPDSIVEEDLHEIQLKVIERALEEGLEDEINKIIEDYYPIEFEPEVNLTERAYEIHIDTMSGDKEDLYLYFTEDFTLLVQYFIPKSDYFIDLKKNIEIIDSNWNKWVMHVEENFTIQVGFEVNMYKNEILELNYFVDDELIPFCPGSEYEDYYKYEEQLKNK